ncbi:GNAT family N-acetyltransferase [Ekhidna sp. To15]|uniref:GNAT family N-acetyltransferase n=1 Tax=Ekhidna sp. To15 TaxID=3395267 RepID=UPI003F51DA09
MKEWYVTLADQKVELLPITLDHIKEMRNLSSDSDVWTWYTEDLTDPDALEKWMTQRLDASRKGLQMTYSVRLKETGEIIGATSYGHIDWEEHGIEIGWTWLGKKYIGVGINKHMKYLMLRHAFETMQIERLELRTDENNIRSRKAMEKIGAKHDGTLRNHRSTQGERRRNTVVYSIIKSEWPEIKNSIFKDF